MASLTQLEESILQRLGIRGMNTTPAAAPEVKTEADLRIGILETQEGHNMINILSWALKIVSLLPVIAQGVHQVHADLPSKLTAAQDALQLVTSSAAALVPPEDQAAAVAIGAAASTALASTVTALHNAGAAPQGS